VFGKAWDLVATLFAERGFGGFGGGGGFVGGGASTDDPLTWAILYDENARSVLKQDAYHQWSRLWDYDVVENGWSIAGTGGYVQFNREGKLTLDGWTRYGQFEIGGYWSTVGGTPTLVVTHRFFREADKTRRTRSP
jgi:hypothetical protein